MMPENEYVIRIVNDTETPGGQHMTSRMTSRTDSGAGGDDTFIRPAIAHSMYSFAKGAVRSGVTQVINTVQIRTGSVSMQQDINALQEVGRAAWSAGESVVGGFIIGGPAGALVMGGINIANRGVQYALRQNALQIGRAVEGASIELNNIRAGADGSRR